MKNIEKNKSYIIKDFSYIDLSNILIGKLTQFKSDCEFFPNFDVIGKVKRISIAKNNEILIHIIVKNKEYQIGSNMSNLSFQLL